MASRKLVSILCLACLSTWATIGIAAESGDKAAIRKTFEAYKAAILKDDGKAAANLVTDNTIDYYGKMKRLAVYASENYVKAQSLVDQMMALLLRLQIAPDSLKKMTGKEVFAEAVKRGWTSKARSAKQDVGAIIVSGDTGVRQYVAARQEDQPGLSF